MTHCVFAAGARLAIESRGYHLRRKISGGRWQLENDLDGELMVMSEDELHGLYRENRMRFIVTDEVCGEDLDQAVNEKIARNFSDYSEKLQRIAEKRLKYIRAIEKVPQEDQDDEIARIAKHLRDVAPPNLGTVRRWTRILRDSTTGIVALIPQYAGRGNKTPRYPDEVVEIAANELRRLYLSKERISLTETLSSIRDAIEQVNLRRPTHKKLPKPRRKFLRLLLAKVDEYERMRSRYGKSVADRHFRASLQSGEMDYEPLARVEIDHTVLDLIVVHPVTFLALGRPTITVALDRRTRGVLGFYVSFEPPGYVQVMKCLAHAIKPKDYIRTKYPQIQNDWPFWGIPIQAVLDNAREFHSKDLEAAALSLLIELRYSPVAQPWWKGGVERFFRTLSKSLIHTLPGTTFSNPGEKKDYNSKKQAMVTLDVLDEILHTWICDVYHQTVHRSTLCTPAALWRELIDPTKQKLPPSAEMLEVNLASIETRTLFHYGISLNELTYNSRELQALHRRKGKIKVTVRWNRSDLGFIHILDENTNTYIKVPCTWFSYASGVSLWLHKAIRSEALSQEGVENEAKLDAAKTRLRNICMKAMGSKLLATRKTAARAEQGLASPVIPLQLEQTQPSNDLTNSPAWASDQDNEIPEFKVTVRPLNEGRERIIYENA